MPKVPVLIAVAGVLISSSALAQVDNGQARAVRVRISDLDLRHAGGQAVLHQRIANAAAASCGPAPSIVSLDRAQRYRACVKVAIDGASVFADQAVQAASLDGVALASAK